MQRARSLDTTGIRHARRARRLVPSVCTRANKSNRARYRVRFWTRTSRSHGSHGQRSAYPFQCTEPLSQRQLGILVRIGPEFLQDTIPHEILSLIQQKAALSLRALDWLVTNYAKKNNIVSITTRSNIFNIYHGYKVSLSHYRRRHFDPFRRRARIVLCHGEERYETTVSPCNFLHWAHVNGVLAYAFANAQKIESDMNASASHQKLERKRQRANGQPYKRRELSQAPVAKCQVFKVETNVSFVNE